MNTTSRLLRQGEFVAPDVQAMGNPEPVKPNPQAMNGLLARFSKKHAASDSPTAFGSVQAVYADAIATMEAAGSAQMRGAGLLTFFTIAVIVSVGVPGVAHLMYEELMLPGTSLFLLAQGVVLLYVAWRFGIKMLPILWRLDMFAAENQPTIFDRKHRKVYRLFSPVDGSASKGAWRGTPIVMQAAEYDWDSISAEHRVELITRGNSVARIHRLIMVARDRPRRGESYGRLLEEFEIGNAMALGELTVPRLWEHIRRYMEEGGPPVPEGEPLQVFERPRTLWQSMGVVSPFGPRFGWWWRTGPLMTSLFIVGAPLTVPFFTLWATCNWISHKTMRKTVWPQEVHERIGKAVRSA